MHDHPRKSRLAELVASAAAAAAAAGSDEDFHLRVPSWADQADVDILPFDPVTHETGPHLRQA